MLRQQELQVPRAKLARNRTSQKRIANPLVHWHTQHGRLYQQVRRDARVNAHVQHSGTDGVAHAKSCSTESAGKQRCVGAAGPLPAALGKGAVLHELEERASKQVPRCEHVREVLQRSGSSCNSQPCAFCTLRLAARHAVSSVVAQRNLLEE